MLIVRARFPNIDPTDSYTQPNVFIEGEVDFFFADTNRTILAKVREVVFGVEKHEIHEWLRVDGKPLRNPHPNGGTLTS